MDDEGLAPGVVAPERPAPAAPHIPDGQPSTNGTPPSPPPRVPDGDGDGEPARARGFRRGGLRLFVIPIVAIVVLAAGAFGVNYYFNNLWYVSTDNAEVSGTPVPVGPLNAGRVEAIDVQTGSAVRKGEPLATVVLAALSNQAPVREEIVAPFDCVVIGIPVGVGATVSPGQGIVTVVDPSTLYVNANIDENDVKRVRPGQPVDVHLDALSETIPGVVDSITPASAATFSLLPQDNTTGTFTKVTQLVPVKIDVAAENQPLLVGTSVEVKIHVAGH